MSDIPPPIPGPSSSPAATPDPFAAAPGSTPQMSPGEVADGKLLAILSYVLPIVAIVVVIIRNNSFSLYHAKQVMVAVLLLAAMSIGAAVISFIPIVVCLTPPTLLLAVVVYLIFMIMGIINAATDKAVPLPLIGHLADRWFASLQKLPTP